MSLMTSAPSPALAPPVEPGPSGTQLRVGGMTCGACARRIETTLNGIGGITASVNYATRTATVTHPTSVQADVLVAVLEDLGYTAAPLGQPARPAGPVRRLWRRLWGRHVPVPHPAVVDVAVAHGVDLDDAIGLAGAVEAGAEHPVGEAIADYAATFVPFWPAMFDVASIPGGRTGDTGARVVVIGGAAALAERGIALPLELTAAVDLADAAAHLPVVLAWAQDGDAPEARAVLTVARA